MTVLEGSYNGYSSSYICSVDDYKVYFPWWISVRRKQEKDEETICKPTVP